MKLFKLLLSLFVCLFFLCPTGFAQKKPITKIHRQKASTKDASGWYYAKSTEGHFSVLLPMSFADYSVIAWDTLGKEIKTFAVGCKSDDNFEFGVMEIPRNKNKVDLKSMIKSFKPTAIKEEHTAAYSSIFGKVEGGGRYGYIKYVVTPKSLIMMSAECLTPTKSDLDRIYLTFFNSLKLL
ncbi:MAG: hypothetical protein V4635_01525 [Bacteroidota bacterium]